MVHFVIIDKGWKPLTIIPKRSILDVATVLDPPLISTEQVILERFGTDIHKTLMIKR